MSNAQRVMTRVAVDLVLTVIIAVGVLVLTDKGLATSLVAGFLGTVAMRIVSLMARGKV